MSSKRDPQYRPNPNRCVFIAGEFNQALVDRLTREILKLTSDSAEPITAYIDSPGGNTYFANVVRRLLSSPSQDGHASSLITVVTGSAHSAAADFLASGNYAIAYPHASVLYHGSRQLVTQAVTTEAAAFLAESLKRTNESFAVQLADNCIHRFMFRYISVLKDEFEGIRNESGDEGLPDITCLVTALRAKVSSLLHPSLEEAQSRYQRNKAMSDHVFGALSKTVSPEDFEKIPQAEFEATVLKSIIDFELQGNPDKNWSFTNDLNQLREDFVLLRDYSKHRAGEQLTFLTKGYNRWFLTRQELQELESIPPAEQDAWAADKVREDILPIWYFFVSLCRALQASDYYLSAMDAYWLGLVDEVMGSDLPNIRILLENPPEEPPSAPR